MNFWTRQQRVLGLFLTFTLLLSFVPMMNGVQVVQATSGTSQPLTVTHVIYQQMVEDALARAKAYYQQVDTVQNDSSYYGYLAALRSAGVNLSKLEWKHSPWDVDSIWQTGTEESLSEIKYAGYILGSLALGEEPHAFGKGKWQRNLVEELAERQDKTTGAFGESTDGHIWAMIALEAAQGEYDQSLAVSYLLTKQNHDGSFQGDWGNRDETGFALTALAKHLNKPGVQDAVNEALGFLQSIQKPELNGDFEGEWGENANTLAAIVSGLVAVGEDLFTPKWTKNGKTPLDALLSYQLADGSFYNPWSIDFSTKDAVNALGDLATGESIWYRLATLPKPTPVYGSSEGGGTGGSVPLPKIGTVTLSVAGLSGQTLLAPTAVELWEGDTAFTVLVRTLADVDFTGSGSTAYVSGIKGLKEFDHGPGSGWMYLIDGADPKKSAGVYELTDGQLVEWKYTADLGQDIGASGGGGAGAGLPAEYVAADNELSQLSLRTDNMKPIEEVERTMIVLHAYKQMNKEEAEKLRALLQKNIFTIQETIAPALGGTLADGQGEVTLFVPAGSVERSINFQVRKLNQTEQEELVSGIYEFSPAGTSFIKPVFISIKTPLFVDDLGELALAWWDEGRKTWIPIPAVVDAQTGVVTGKVSHFTKFAVIDKNKLPSFEKEVAWQKALYESLELLLNKTELSEWEAFSLARAGEIVLPAYLQVLENIVKENKAQFRKVTDLERIVLTLGALGVEPQEFAGHNLVEKIYNHSGMTMQGTNGVAFALLALDSKAYPISAGAEWKREQLIQWLLAQQNEDGGFSLSKTDSGQSDIDITAMVLQSLAVYQKRADVNEATGEAVAWLAEQQLPSGGFVNRDGVENSESVAQVIIALTSLNIDPLDERFVQEKGDLLSNLLSFAQEDGSFAHQHGQDRNDLATEQAVLALLAYKLWNEEQSPLFDLRKFTEETVLAEGSAYVDADMISFWAVEAVQLARKYGLMQGVSSEIPRFEPQRAITRAELATLLLNLAGDQVEPTSKITFLDVGQQDWYYRTIARAVEKGWVKGISSEIFQPNRALTREEMAVMISRMLQLDIETDIQQANSLNDLDQASSWALAAITQMHQQEIMVGDQGHFRPQDVVTREMAAVVMVRLYEQQNE